MIELISIIIPIIIFLIFVIISFIFGGKSPYNITKGPKELINEELKEHHKKINKIARKESIKNFLYSLGLMTLVTLVSYTIYLLIKEITPEYNFFYNTNNADEITDIRETTAFLIAIPLVILLILGFKSIKNKWFETDDIIKNIENKYQITEKLKKEIKDDDDHYHTYENKILLEQIEKIITR